MARKRDDETTTEAAEGGTPAKISKADAVRAALAEGIETPDDGIAFILKKFGIEMGKPMWSSYKTQEKARNAKKGGGTTAKRGRPAAAPAPAAVTAAAAPAPTANGGVADSIVAIKQLVERLGADEVVKIAEIFRQ